MQHNVNATARFISVADAHLAIGQTFAFGVSGILNFDTIEIPTDENAPTYAACDDHGNACATFDTLGDLIYAIANSTDYASGVAASLFHTFPDAIPTLAVTVYHRADA